MGKTAQRKRSFFELGVNDGRKYGTSMHYVRGRKDMVSAYANGVKAGLSKLTPMYSPDYADGADYGALAFESDINEGLWQGLKRFALLAAMVLLILLFTGCSTHTISIGQDSINATSTSFLYCPEARIIRAQDGKRAVDMVGEASGVGAVVQSLGDNAVEVLKP